MSSDTFQSFLNKIGQTPLLTAEEELLYGRQVQEWLEIKDIESPSAEQKRALRRGRRAFDKMFNGNLRLVVSIAKRYTNCCKYMTMDDLIQEGMFGLKRAIEKFDPQRGYKFSTYSYWWIRQAITRSLAQQNDMIRLPIACGECHRKVGRFIPEFLKEQGRFPTMQEMADHCEVSVEAMKGYMKHFGGVTSLDVRAKHSDDDGAFILDLVADNTYNPIDSLASEEAEDVLGKLLHNLSAQQRDIVSCHWGLNGEPPMTLADIGKKNGKSRESTRQMEARAMKRMRFIGGRRLLGTAA